MQIVIRTVTTPLSRIKHSRIPRQTQCGQPFTHVHETVAIATRSSHMYAL